MHLSDLLPYGRSRGLPAVSFEFFPPSSAEGHDRLRDTLRELAAWDPAFVSVTCGAGGSTGTATGHLVSHLRQQTRLNAVPHLTGVRQRQEEVDRLLHHYAELGVGNLLALRGDAPRDAPEHDHRQDRFPRGADLVRHIREFNTRGLHPDKRGFGIGVAGFPEGHPGTPNRLLEMDYLKAKTDAGADFICTQLFFDNRHFHDFRERCELAGIRVPILAGILPVTSMTGLHRMAALAGGTVIPALLLRQLARAGEDPGAVREIGLHHATEQCADLLHHEADGIHFYTLNQAGPATAILRRLGLSPSAAGLSPGGPPASLAGAA